MKKNIIFIGLLSVALSASGQRIDDKNVEFRYVQLPNISAGEDITTFEVVVNHAYESANDDSLNYQDSEMSRFMSRLQYYSAKKDSVSRAYLRSLSTWQQGVYNSKTTADGQPIPKPIPPVYPLMPDLSTEPRLHSAVDDDAVRGSIELDGFERGSGGLSIEIEILPMRDLRIKAVNRGSKTKPKFKAQADFILPMVIRVESPERGILAEHIVRPNSQSVGSKNFATIYDYELFMMDNADTFFEHFESVAREKALDEANDYLNRTFGFISKKREVDIYTVRSHRDHKYGDVNAAYTKTVQALSLLSDDPDRSASGPALEDAIASWTAILEESDTGNDKARINNDITQLIQCNLIELQVWQADFTQAFMRINLAKNGNFRKARRHVERHEDFYGWQRERWEANF